ncbi:hypothetical protein Tco_0930881 [Tanacetum coccineum]
MQEVVKKEIVKLLDTGIIYPIADSRYGGLVYFNRVPKKGGITVVTNENDELVPTRTVMGWRVCIDYRKLNTKDHFPLLFMDQKLERLAGNKYFCFLDGFFGYFQIPIDPNDQEKTRFTCPFGTYTYRRMPFSLFDIEIKDRKGTKNVAADHLSWIENDESSNDSEVDDNFPGETLMEINTKRINHGGTLTFSKYVLTVLDSGFYWPTIIKEAHTLVRLCEARQKTENISKRDEMPLNNI